jgi:large subunit ribosomal protein L27
VSSRPRCCELYQVLEFALCYICRRATKKQGGSTKNKKDSQPKYLGTKMSDGQLAFPGQMLVKQRGTKFHPGHNVGMVRGGAEHTQPAVVFHTITISSSIVMYQVGYSTTPSSLTSLCVVAGGPP